ncbi:YceD family protein [Clostridium minihomine]|uniref:YceD family protein n=1 Tax=Clostridium minihomine TaxID=2045012 RepID=UPI000C7883D9|nr:DUF177 domain-containing protein [Clostridium minihomine]
MILELKKIMLNDGEILPFSYEMSLASTTINGVCPFLSPVAVTGNVRSHAGAAKLDAGVSFDFQIPCDRCTADLSTHYDFKFHHILVSSLNDEDNDLYIVVENDRLDLDELLREDILLELPTKFLCRPDCKGLCPQCGQNLNQGLCQCVSRQTDPRLAVLKQLID